MTRIQVALGLTPNHLANALDLPLRDVLDRHGPRARMSSFVDDPFWQVLLDYVDEKVAGYLSVKETLERKARLDRRAHYERQQQILARNK